VVSAAGAAGTTAGAAGVSVAAAVAAGAAEAGAGVGSTAGVTAGAAAAVVTAGSAALGLLVCRRGGFRLNVGTNQQRLAPPSSPQRPGQQPGQQQARGPVQRQRQLQLIRRVELVLRPFMNPKCSSA
jgi:hypothetical protein